MDKEALDETNYALLNSLRQEEVRRFIQNKNGVKGEAVRVCKKRIKAIVRAMDEVNSI